MPDAWWFGVAAHLQPAPEPMPLLSELEPRLPVRWRNLNLDAVGHALGVSRATAHRWLVRARESLAVATETQLRNRLNLRPSEIQSLRRLVQSQVVVSVRRLLAG